MAKKAILSGTIIGKTAIPDFKDGQRNGEKFHIRIADIENKKFTGSDGVVYETHPVRIYDVKINKEQFLSTVPEQELKLFAKIEMEAHEIVVNGKNGEERVYYRAYDLESGKDEE